MPTLLLLRHAKSSWQNPALDDHDRPLAARGRDSAPRVGAWMREHDLQPDLVLCSTAARALETWALLRPSLAAAPPVRESERLYPGEPAELLEVVRTAPADAERVLLIGHNPGLEIFARSLVGAGEAKPRRRMARKFPTAALAVIGFGDRTWHAIEPGAGRLEAFVRPKDLRADPSGGGP